MIGNESVQKLQELLSKPIGNELTPDEMCFLLKNLSEETDLTSKVFKILENLNQRLVNNPNDLIKYYDIFEKSFISLTNNKKTLIDFSINWVFSLFNKLYSNDESDKELERERERERSISKEDYAIKLIFEVVTNNKLLNADPSSLMKNYNLEENLFYKILKRVRSNVSYLGEIYFIQENVDKKFFSQRDAKNEKKINLKLKIITRYSAKYFGGKYLDFFLLVLSFRFKPNSVVSLSDLEFEKNCLKLASKELCIEEYMFSLIEFCFDNNLEVNSRKQLLFLVFVLFRILPKAILNKLFSYSLTNTNLVAKLTTQSDFSILGDSVTYHFQTLESPTSFIKIVELFINDSFRSSSRLDPNKEHKDKEKEKEYNKQSDESLMLLLNNLIDLFEIVFSIHKTFKINSVAFYNFYFSIQLKLMKNCPFISDNIKKRLSIEFYNNKHNISSVIDKYNSKFQQNSNFSEKLFKKFYRSDLNLIYTNWLTFIYKNTNIFDSFSATRAFLLSPKENEKLHTLSTIRSVEKFYPGLLKIVLSSFLSDFNKRDFQENYNLIVNLKCLNYFEAPGNVQTGSLSSNSFFNSISFNLKIILAFFIEKFSILIAIFFSNEPQLAVINSMAKERKSDNLDCIFDDYLDNKLKSGMGKEAKFNDKMDIDPFQDIQGDYDYDQDHDQQHENLHSKSFSKGESKILIKTKIEVLNILGIILNNLNDVDRLSPDILTFICKLVSIFILEKESSEIRSKIANLIKLMKSNYKKTIGKDTQLPIQLNNKKIITSIVRYLLIKAIEGQGETDISRKKFFKFLTEFLSDIKLEDEEIDPVIHQVISYTKSIIYKSVDNRSFKNPILLKSANTLDDINERVLSNTFLVDIIGFLGKKSQLLFYGFYIRFLEFSVHYIKVTRTLPESVLTLLLTLIDNHWIPFYFKNLVNRLETLVTREVSTKFINFVIVFLKEINPTEIKLEEIETKYPEKYEKFIVLYNILAVECVSILKTKQTAKFGDYYTVDR